MFFLKELPTRAMMERYAARFPEMDVGRTATALGLLRRASLLLRRLDAYFSEFGLSQTRFLVLIVLEREEDRERYRMADLVRRIDVSKPVMTKVVRGLEADGLVSVEASPADKRVKHVAITKAGRSLLAEVLPGYFTLLREAELGPMPEAAPATLTGSGS
jgi:DNA-binding MarR family transcriptional regulator